MHGTEVGQTEFEFGFESNVMDIGLGRLHVFIPIGRLEGRIGVRGLVNGLVAGRTGAERGDSSECAARSQG